MKKAKRINEFSTYNDTDKFALFVSGYFGLFDTKEEAEEVYKLIFKYDQDFDSTPFGSACILEPQYEPKYIDDRTWQYRVSEHRPIDIKNYILKRHIRSNNKCYDWETYRIFHSIRTINLPG